MNRRISWCLANHCIPFFFFPTFFFLELTFQNVKWFNTLPINNNCCCHKHVSRVLKWSNGTFSGTPNNLHWDPSLNLDPLSGRIFALHQAVPVSNNRLRFTTATPSTRLACRSRLPGYTDLRLAPGSSWWRNGGWVAESVQQMALNPCLWR